MNAQNYTQKSLQAIQAAQQLTIQNQNQQIEQVHLLSALLQQDGGLVPQLLKKDGHFRREPGCRRHGGGQQAAARDRLRPGSRPLLCLAPSR